MTAFREINKKIKRRKDVGIMKKWKKLGSILLVMIMVLTMTIPAFASELSGSQGSETGKITITGVVNNQQYDLYRIFDLSYAGSGDSLTVAYTIAEKWVDFFNGTGAKYIVDAQEKDENGQETSSYAVVTIGQQTKYIALTDENVAEFAQEALAYAVSLPEESVDESVIARTEATETEAKNTFTDDDGKDCITVEGLILGTYLVYPRGAAEIGEGFSSICSLTSTTPSANVVVKATYPDVDKKIAVDEDTDDLNNIQGAIAGNRPSGTDEDEDYNTAAIGDDVPYIVTSRVPSMAGYKNYFFIFDDTLSKGLTFNEDVEISIGDTKLTEWKDKSEPRENFDYYVNVTEDETTGKTHVEIVFIDFIKWADEAGKDITVTYSAKLNEEAEIGTIPNTNEIYLKYSNDPRDENRGTPETPDEPKPDDPIGESPIIKTYTYVLGLLLHKTDENGNSLTGAEFTIKGTKLNRVVTEELAFVADENGDWYLLDDNTYTQTVPGSETGETNEDGTPVLVADDKYVKNADGEYARFKKVYTIDAVPVEGDLTEEVEITAWVDENGELQFKGLSEGTYTITEVTAPNGYNKLANPITIIVSYEISRADGAAVIAWNVTKQIGDNIESETLEMDEDTMLFTIDIENRSGSLLPSTGGIGTTIFYVVGGILVLGAGVMLVTKKRMSGRE